MFHYNYWEKAYETTRVLSNKQIAKMVCYRDGFIQPYDFYIAFCVADKKKHIRAWLNQEENPLEAQATGKCGSEALLFAYHALQELEGVLKADYMTTTRIIVQGADQRRFRLYQKWLMKKIGYKKAFSRERGWYLYKTITSE